MIKSGNSCYAKDYLSPIQKIGIAYQCVLFHNRHLSVQEQVCFATDDRDNNTQKNEIFILYTAGAHNHFSLFILLLRLHF